MKLSLTFLFFLSLFFHLYAQKSATIAVLDLDAEGISASESRIISARLRTDLFNTGKYTVLERDKMQNILDEQGFQLSGCTTNECVIEAGKLIGVEKIVAGNIGKIGKLITITIRLVDIETGKVLQTATEDCECPIERVVTQSVKNVAEILSGNTVEASDYLFNESDIKTNNKPDWMSLGLTRSEYLEFKNSGLKYNDWLQYSESRVYPIGNAAKSFLIPGWGQLSLDRNRGYWILPLNMLLWYAFVEYYDRSEMYARIARDKQEIGDYRSADVNWDKRAKYEDVFYTFLYAAISTHVLSSFDSYMPSVKDNNELDDKYKISFIPKLDKYLKQTMLGVNIEF